VAQDAAARGQAAPNKRVRPALGRRVRTGARGARGWCV